MKFPFRRNRLSKKLQSFRKKFWVTVIILSIFSIAIAYRNQQRHVDEVTNALQEQIDDLQTQIHLAKLESHEFKDLANKIKEEKSLNIYKFKGNQHSKNSVCVDSDAYAEKKAKFIRGSVALINKNKKKQIFYDECLDLGAKVKELSCAEQPKGSGQFKLIQKVAICPQGCFNGACR